MQFLELDSVTTEGARRFAVAGRNKRTGTTGARSNGGIAIFGTARLSHLYGLALPREQHSRAAAIDAAGATARAHRTGDRGNRRDEPHAVPASATPPLLRPPHEPQVESREQQDDPDVRQQPRQDVMPEEHEVRPDDDHDHSHHVGNPDCGSRHLLSPLRAYSRRPFGIPAQVPARSARGTPGAPRSHTRTPFGAR